ncbi:MAG: beta family protein [Planctomycetes bacterium]|nr:beta family protein [Planctomycetota bacterium]
MNQIKYQPIIKTGDAEFRAINNLSDDVQNSITPLFELTRSRTSPKKKHGDIYRRLDKLKEVYGDRGFCLDLTTAKNLINYQIKELQDSTDGYAKWVDFLISQKDNFPQIIPVIMLDFVKGETEQAFYSKLKSQVEKLNSNFEKIAYRFSYNYPEYKYDIEKMSESVPTNKLITILDIGFMPNEKISDYKTLVDPVISNLKKINPNQIILATSSYPKLPTDYGGEKEGEFPLDKLKLYSCFDSITYGDYATVHPVRSSQAGGNGWIPRIDMPTKKGTVFYYRSRKTDGEDRYDKAYIRVAKKVVSNEDYQRTKRFIGDCWGIEQIELAAARKPQKLSPSFWISVRMNIHITLRTKILTT